MSASADTDILQARFAGEWAALNPGVPVIYENAPAEAPPKDAPWLRFAVRPQALQRAGYTAGASRHEGIGRVEVQVFVPRGSGTAMRDLLADEAGEILRGWRSTNDLLRCGEPEFTTPTPDEREQWSMRRVSVPYRSTRLL